MIFSASCSFCAGVFSYLSISVQIDLSIFAINLYKKQCHSVWSPILIYVVSSLFTAKILDNLTHHVCLECKYFVPISRLRSLVCLSRISNPTSLSGPHGYWFCVFLFCINSNHGVFMLSTEDTSYSIAASVYHGVKKLGKVGLRMTSWLLHCFKFLSVWKNNQNSTHWRRPQVCLLQMQRTRADLRGQFIHR